MNEKKEIAQKEIKPAEMAESGLESAKIIENHKSKSMQVKKYQERLKRQIPVAHLKKLVENEKAKMELNSGKHEDDEDFSKAQIKHEARIELLEELISLR